MDGPREFHKYRLLAAIASTVVLLDQWTKYLVHTRFHWGESVNILSSFFALTYVRNSGAAFGLLHRAPPQFRDPFFVIVPIVALTVIFAIYLRLTRDQRLTAWALSLIVGGALGNLIDRLRFGFVIDFLDFHWKEVYHWPAFNVADSCIVVGVSLMFLQSFFPGAGCTTNITDKKCA
jgi:signal peptidase II